MRLRELHGVLAPLRGRHPAAGRALDLLERDLLPRSAGGDASLVVGIVGPNNAGKSALFNALTGRRLSPSLPAGGATRRLVGAAPPDLLAMFRAEPTLARFRLRAIDDVAELASQALTPAEDPAELLIVDEPTLPAGLMLIDTPDFDSILQDNRLGSESLLTVADLVLVVVTRHSYQNREVVSFLRRWLADGRPWILVYNEAIDVPVTRTHATKLASDVGTPPLAVYAAPHNLDVQRDARALDPERVAMDGDSAASKTASAPPTHQRLRDFLFDLRAAADIKSLAFAAALARLRHDVDELASLLAAASAQAHGVLNAAAERALEAGQQVAAAAMPGGPFIEAFRNVLDRRSNPLSRSWRSTLRGLRLRLESLPSLFRNRRVTTAESAMTALSSIEREALAGVWPRFWEELVRDLGTEARHLARRNAAAEIGRSLDTDLRDGESSSAKVRAEQALQVQPADLGAFERACEVLVEKAIEDRGFDLDIQAAADIATLLPLALAAAVIVKTGGLGTDLAAAGGGALGTFLFEKYAHLLGGGILTEARRRWTELRGRQLGEILADAALPQTGPLLRTAADDDAQAAAALRRLAVQLC